MSKTQNPLPPPNEKITRQLQRMLASPNFNASYVHFSLWVNCLRQKDYAGAYHEILRLNAHVFFWDQIVRASSLGLLGNIEDGRKVAAELLELKPDFPSRGRILIRYYIKFEDIVERVIKGLNAVGIAVR
jgi:adenylate cyclase